MNLILQCNEWSDIVTIDCTKEKRGRKNSADDFRVDMIYGMELFRKVQSETSRGLVWLQWDKVCLNEYVYLLPIDIDSVGVGVGVGVNL